jgi:hypothetical protein
MTLQKADELLLFLLQVVELSKFFPQLPEPFLRRSDNTVQVQGCSS